MGNNVDISILAQDRASATLNGIAGSLRNLEAAAGTTASGVSRADVAWGAFAGTLSANVAMAVTQASMALVSFAQNSIMTAARVQELEAVTMMLGQKAGMSKTEIISSTEAIKNLGITSEVANNLMGQFIRYQLSAADAVKLARVAQDAAVLSGQDSSQTLAQLLHGVLTYQPEVIRMAGLNVNLEQTFIDLAKSTGVARSELSQTDRVQATLNAVFAEGARVAGAYETAMLEPGKQLRSLMGRELPTLAEEFGKSFLEAFGTTVMATRELVKELIVAVKEGGSMHDMLDQVGKTAAETAKTIADLVKQITTFAVQHGEVIKVVVALVGAYKAWEVAQGAIKGISLVVAGLQAGYNKLIWESVPATAAATTATEGLARARMEAALAGVTGGAFGGGLPSGGAPVPTAYSKQIQAVTTLMVGAIAVESMVVAGQAIQAYIQDTQKNIGATDLLADTLKKAIEASGLPELTKSRLADRLAELEQEVTDGLRSQSGFGSGLIALSTDLRNTSIEFGTLGAVIAGVSGAIDTLPAKLTRMVDEKEQPVIRVGTAKYTADSSGSGAPWGMPASVWKATLQTAERLNEIAEVQKWLRANPGDPAGLAVLKSLLGVAEKTAVTLEGGLAQAFPSVGAAQGWMGAFAEQHGGRAPGAVDVRDQQASVLFQQKYGRGPTEEEWQKRYYTGSFEGIDESTLDAIYGKPGTWKILLEGQAETTSKQTAAIEAAFVALGKGTLTTSFAKAQEVIVTNFPVGGGGGGNGNSGEAETWSDDPNDSGYEISNLGHRRPKPMAYGDFFSRATNVIVGEAGPEVILPLSKPERASQLLGQAIQYAPSIMRGLPMPMAQGGMMAGGAGPLRLSAPSPVNVTIAGGTFLGTEAEAQAFARKIKKYLDREGARTL